MILGIRLMVKAIRNEHWKNIWNIILESGDLSDGMYQWNLHAAYRNCIWISGNECAYDSDHDCLCTVAFVIGGIYTGYRVGYEAKTKVYIVGALLLWVAGLDVLIGRIL